MEDFDYEAVADLQFDRKQEKVRSLAVIGLGLLFMFIVASSIAVYVFGIAALG